VPCRSQSVGLASLPNPCAICPSQLPCCILGFQFGSNNLFNKLSLPEQANVAGNEGPGGLKLPFSSKTCWHIGVWRTGSWAFVELLLSFTWRWCKLVGLCAHGVESLSDHLHFSTLEQCSWKASMNNCSKGYLDDLSFHSQWGCCWRYMRSPFLTTGGFFIPFKASRSEIADNFVLCGRDTFPCQILHVIFMFRVLTEFVEWSPLRYYVALLWHFHPTPQTNFGHWIRLGIFSISQHCESRRLSFQVSELEFRCKVERD
jgi:hypothetical protein